MKLRHILNKILSEQLITETFINVFDKKDMQKYADEVWILLQKQYSRIGGFKTAKTKEDLINKSWMWKMSRRDGKIVAVSVYKYKNGRKSIAKGYDGSEIGKKDIVQIYKDDINFKRGWAEVSGSPEKLMIHLGGIPIPNKYAHELLNKNIISLNQDGFHYTRLIDGHPHEKIIIGNIQSDIPDVK